MFTTKPSSQNNPEKSYTKKIVKHIPSGCSSSLICSFDAPKNKHDHYRGEYCIGWLCKKIREHAEKIINYNEKEMILLTDEEIEFYEKQKVCHICKRKTVSIKIKKVNLKYAIKLEIIGVTPERLEEPLLIFAI